MSTYTPKIKAHITSRVLLAYSFSRSLLYLYLNFASVLKLFQYRDALPFVLVQLIRLHRLKNTAQGVTVLKSFNNYIGVSTYFRFRLWLTYKKKKLKF